MAKVNRLLKLGALLVVGILATASVAYAEVVEDGRVTIHCADHAIQVSYVAFTLDGLIVYDDPAPGLECGPGGGDSKYYHFGAGGIDINDFQFDYICDGGLLTHVVIPAGVFYFHMPIALTCPSPGGMIDYVPGAVSEGDPILIVSDHDVLMWPSAECFYFTGAVYDYVCVTWYCEGPFDPEFEIYPGCAAPCDDPTCPPAVYAGIGMSAICNPVPNIFCRLFWPIGLTQPGCWCYYFEYQLAVELSEFYATPRAGAVSVDFATASERDNAHFEIWRSTSQDGPFTEVARISSQGNSPNRQSYEFVDESVQAGETYWYYLVSVDLAGHRKEHRDLMSSAGVNGSTAVPTGYALSAYPNPFNPTTTLAFSLPVSGMTKIAVYDLAGRMVRELAGGSFEAGEYRVPFDASALPTGIYVARLESGSAALTAKLLLIK